MKSCVGATARMVSWLRALPQTKPLQLQQPVPLVSAVMRYTSMLDIITPVRYLTMARPSVGVQTQAANWVMVTLLATYSHSIPGTLVGM